MKCVFKTIIMVYVISLSILSLASLSWGQYYPYQNQMPTINININFGGYGYGSSGSYPMGYSSYAPSPAYQYPASSSIYSGPYQTPAYQYPAYPYIGPGPVTVGTYPGPAYRYPASSGTYPVLTGAYIPYSAGELTMDQVFIPNSTLEGEYIYAVFVEDNAEGRAGLAIFRPSGSEDEYDEYLSHIYLSEAAVGRWYNPNGMASMPKKIIVAGDLAVIGCDDLGMLYLVDVSDKENPKVINTLKLSDGIDDNGVDRILSMAIEGQVLFVCIEDLDGTLILDHGSDEYKVYALDISDPENVNVEQDLLGSYKVDSDYKVYGMVSTPGYLYLSGKRCTQEGYGLTIHVIDSQDPANLKEVKIFDELGAPAAMEPELSIVADGNYLLAAVEAEEEFNPPSINFSSKLAIIDMSDPTNPKLLSTSQKMDGQHLIFGDGGIVVNGDYAYLLATTRTPYQAVAVPPSISTTKVYAIDISDPQNPDIVKTSEGVAGLGYGICLAADGRLCLQTENVTRFFDISDPENLLVLEKSIYIEGMLENALAGVSGFQYSTLPVYENPYPGSQSALSPGLPYYTPYFEPGPYGSITSVPLYCGGYPVSSQTSPYVPVSMNAISGYGYTGYGSVSSTPPKYYGYYGYGSYGPASPSISSYGTYYPQPAPYQPLSGYSSYIAQ